MLEEGLRLGTVGGNGERIEMAEQIARVRALRKMSKMVGSFLSYEFEGEPIVHSILKLVVPIDVVFLGSICERCWSLNKLGTFKPADERYSGIRVCQFW